MEVKIIQDAIIYEGYIIEEHYELVGNSITRLYKVSKENGDGEIIKSGIATKQATVTYINAILKAKN